MFKALHRPLAILAIIAMTACSSTKNTGVPSGPVLPANGGLTQQNFVGIGDSLTFGEEGSGELGAIDTSSVSALPGGLVQTTQTNGFWALMYAQKNGITLDPTIGNWNVDTVLGTVNSPLPLIKAPGLGGELVVSSVSPPFTATHSSCDSFNQLAYSSSGWVSTRVNPGGPIADLGVPGMTMHEAVSMIAPLTGPPNGPNCGYVTLPGDPTSGNLQSLIASESENYYPVLGQFSSVLGRNATALNSAVYLKPQLATVWLGANDMLKFIFSHGQAPTTDTPTQLASDLTKIVTTLEASGTKVVVGNLPDLLGNQGAEEPLPQFFPQPKLSADLQALGVPSAAADATAAYVSAHYTQGNGGFLTESGFFAVVAQVQGGSVTPNLDPSGTGSGDGPLYLDQSFATQAIALNAGYNQAINAVAAGTGAGLADVQTAFQQLDSNGYPFGPFTLTLQFGGGLVSYDGLHPSNTGYALLANLFIGAADTKFSLTIPPLTAAQIGTGGQANGIEENDQNNPYVIKSLNPAWPFPLP